MPDQKENPRLTTFLRTFFQAQPINLLDEEKKQLSTLEKKKKQRKIQAETQLKHQAHGGLSWNHFMGDSKFEDDETKKMRSAYNQILQLTVSLCGSGISSEELHTACQMFYKIFTDAKSSETEMKQRVTEEFGFLLSAKDFEFMKNTFEALEKFRKGRLNRPERESVGQEESGNHEWGRNLHLHLTFDALPIEPQGAASQSSSSTTLLPQHSHPHSHHPQKPAPVTHSQYAQATPSSAQTPNSKGKNTNNAKPLSGKVSVGAQALDTPANYWQMVGNMPVEGNWLTEQCAAYIESCHGQCAFSAHELAQNVYSELQSTKSNLQLQSALFETLGESSFEFIEVLLKKRIEILSHMRLMQAAGPKGPRSSASSSTTGGSAPRGASVTVQSEEEKRLEKLRLKELKKQQRQNKKGEVDPAEEELSQQLNLKELREQRQRELSAPLTLDNLHDAGTLVDTLLGMHTNIALPEGTTKLSCSTHNEFIVPCQIPDPIEERALVPISAFAEWARVVFPNYKTMNRMQSVVFEAAYKSNENLLVCAPTGAGKTDVAMMTILHELSNHVVQGKVIGGSFKIVYVAPMKALAAEQTANFARRLRVLGLVCKELTGDMQLTKKELQETHVIVTTPEKWDVITRKSGDVALTSMVRLLIIDEVHLLHEERGPVLEVLVARTLRQVEATQSMIRIVGLSATLPNYKDVALFLRVNPDTGLFHFDSRYRPVPLSMRFIGAKETNPVRQKLQMNDICYQKVVHSLKQGHQVMVFVHSRKDTAKTAEALRELANSNNQLPIFSAAEDPNWSEARKAMGKSKNRELSALFEFGFGIHHAGMLRSDRSLVENLFSKGHIKVLCCTATLAWGVNLPAHTVVIKGTQIYDAKHGTFVELGMLDVMQIFGRAGRPQFDTSGEGIIITADNKLAHYLALLSHQMPIESQFTAALPDHLNAEVILGTVTNVDEAVTWLSYTYLYVRMMRNPMAYSILHKDKELDPHLHKKRRELVLEAAMLLDKHQMIRFDEKSGVFAGTDLGRTASHFYINHDTVAHFNENLVDTMTEPDILALIAQSSEFQNIMLREEEFNELDKLLNTACQIDVRGGSENKHGKVNILLQAYLSQAPIDGFALVSDSAYVVQNAGRILRALFSIVHKRGWAGMAAKTLALCKMVERRIWHTEHPLAQFEAFSREILYKLVTRKMDMDEL